jgi:hypothetical protein
MVDATAQPPTASHQWIPRSNARQDRTGANGALRRRGPRLRPSPVTPRTVQTGTTRMDPGGAVAHRDRGLLRRTRTGRRSRAVLWRRHPPAGRGVRRRRPDRPRRHRGGRRGHAGDQRPAWRRRSPPIAVTRSRARPAVNAERLEPGGEGVAAIDLGAGPAPIAVDDRDRIGPHRGGQDRPPAMRDCRKGRSVARAIRRTVHHRPIGRLCAVVDDD